MYPLPVQDDITRILMMNLLQKYDADLDQIIAWSSKQKLPRDVWQVFALDKRLPDNDPFNEMVLALRNKMSVLTRALREVGSLLQHSEHWVHFAFALKVSGYWGKQVAATIQTNTKKSDAIKRKILDKTIEVVNLAKDLENLGGYDRAGLPSERVYPALLKKAESIHHAAYTAEETDGKLPGVSNWNNCIYTEFVEPKLPDIWDWDDHPLPSIESIILAYGQYISENEEDAVYFNPVRFSKRRSPGDVIRFFTQHIAYMVEIGRLPESIKRLSFLSIEIFVGVLFPNTIIKAGNYIDENWSPIKDSDG
ncbi:hypothetical protein [Methylomonas sp. MK1]|uniref:hypothetical protein n=1 Tax=Methylomonas sp. MK1 TaxID=1131552 RepID=UPI00037285C8|nr:hypothetical protein [Methylomonas sp. MK1]